MFLNEYTGIYRALIHAHVHVCISNLWYYLQEWIPLVACKQAAFHGMAEFYQSCVSQQSKTYGEQIARLQVSYPGIMARKIIRHILLWWFLLFHSENDIYKWNEYINSRIQGYTIMLTKYQYVFLEVNKIKFEIVLRYL